MPEPSKPEPLRPPGMHDPSTVAVVQIGGRWYTRFTTLALPEPRLRGVVALVGTTYYMPHDADDAEAQANALGLTTEPYVWPDAERERETGERLMAKFPGLRAP